MPVTRARFEAWSDGDLVLEGHTDASGNIDLRDVSPNSLDRLLVFAEAWGDTPVEVRDCPEGRCDEGGALYAYEITADQIDAGVAVIGIESDVAGAFHIREVLQDGMRFVRQHYPEVELETLTAEWRAGANTACNTSCYSSETWGRTIYVLGLDSDSDEHDSQILLHELGHYLEHIFGIADGAGGYHDGSPTRPELAWSEGWCTAFALAASDDPVYVDTDVGGGGWYDYTGVDAVAVAPKYEGQDVSEDLVVEVLWRFYTAESDNPTNGASAVFRAAGDRLSVMDRSSRGGPGTDLVDFLDAFIAEAPELEALLVETVILEHGFPYAGVTQAPTLGEPDGGYHESPITPAAIEFLRGDLDGAVALRAVARAKTGIEGGELQVLGLESCSVQGERRVASATPMVRNDEVVADLIVSSCGDDEWVSARFDMVIGTGSAYVMTGSAPLDGDWPATGTTGASYRETLPDGSTIRVDAED